MNSFPLYLNNLLNNSGIGSPDENTSLKLSGSPAGQRTINRLALLKLLSEVSEDLRKEKIEFLLVKGLAFELSFYPEGYQRSFSDLDFLIDKKDLPKVRSILETKGFKPELKVTEKELAYEIKQQHALCFVGPQGEEVDIHWRLIQEQFSIEDKRLELFTGKIGFEHQGIKFDAPSLELHFLLVVVQAYKTLWQELKYLVDIEQALSSGKLDLAVVSELAKNSGMETILLFNQAVCTRVWGRGEEEPEILPDWFKQPLQLVLERLEKGEEISEFERLKIELSFRSSLAAKVKLRELLFRTREIGS